LVLCTDRLAAVMLRVRMTPETRMAVIMAIPCSLRRRWMSFISVGGDGGADAGRVAVDGVATLHGGVGAHVGAVLGVLVHQEGDVHDALGRVYAEGGRGPGHVDQVV